MIRGLSPLLVPLLAAGVTLSACDEAGPDADDMVDGYGELIDRVSSAITADSVRAIDGRYAGTCAGGAGEWTLALNDYVLGAGEAALTVARSDAACKLSVTAVRAGALAALQAFKPATPVLLAANFPKTGVAFAWAGTNATAFYATFRITPDTTFADDFVVQMMYADDLHETNLDINTTTAIGPAPLDLGAAADFAWLCASGGSVGEHAKITGDVGVTARATSALTGLALVRDASRTFSTSTAVSGKVFGAEHAPPTPARLAASATALNNAIADARARKGPDRTNLGAGKLAGLVISPGLYVWTTSVVATNDVTLSGSPDDTWILRVDGALSMSASRRTRLVGGAQARNIFWVVTGAVTLSPKARLDGIVLARAAITTGEGVNIDGRLLGQGTITLGPNGSLTQPP